MSLSGQKTTKTVDFFKLTRHEAHRQVTIERVKLIEGATYASGQTLER